MVEMALYEAYYPAEEDLLDPVSVQEMVFNMSSRLQAVSLLL